MVELSALWLPIVLSAVLVFVASSVIHMVVPIHRGDYTKLPGEDAVLAAMRSQGVQPGQYMFPCPSSMKDMCTPEMQQKFTQGPVGTLVVRPSGPPAMGKNLVQWFLYTLVIGFCTAYVCHLALGPGTAGMSVFRVAGAVALLPYAVTYVTDSIWKGVRWSTALKFVFDGLVYALLTGAAFAWLWPAAA
jgi:hypothetical protein